MNTPKKMLVIGIDGLDPVVLTQLGDCLPNFKKIMDASPRISTASTFPPDSICAWSSIYTGLNPAEHGIIDNVDYLDIKKLKDFKVDQGLYKGRTFWDELGKLGKKVIIINPFLAYPAWEVNGIMICGAVFEGGDISTYPPGIKDRYTFPEMGGIIDFPDRSELKDFSQRTLKNTREISACSLHVLRENPWDFAFISFLTLDRIKHFFWRYHDGTDPTHPKDNEFQDTVKMFYREYDAIIGAYMTSFSDAKIVVISDHGHRRRCTKCLNTNEYLRKKGYLITQTGNKLFSCKVAVEKLKTSALNVIDRANLHDIAFKLAKLVPHRRELKKSSYIIDKEKSVCFTSEAFGTNPFGGIEINKRALAGRDYETVRQQIIADLRSLDPATDIFKWIKTREEVYQGMYITKYPDILFELHEEYGVNWSVFGDLVTTNPMHKKISGGHKSEAALLIYPVSEQDQVNRLKINSVLDIRHYILDFFKSI